MKKLLALAAAAAALLAGRVSAAETPDARYFTVDENSITIEEITDKGGTLPTDPGPVPSTPSMPVPTDLPQPPSGPSFPALTPGAGGPDFTGFNNTMDALDRIMNMMEKIFSIIDRNQPVVNITTNYANAVPFGTSHWAQLQGWSRPAVKKYAFSMKNGLGGEVVKVTYQVHYTYNGNFQGKGKFLTGVTVEPLNVTTAWGYKVSLVSEVPDSTVANVGTHEDPVASMQVQLKWTVHTVLKDTTSKAIYYVQGDGLLQELGTPFKNSVELKNRARIDGVKKNLTDISFN